MRAALLALTIADCAARGAGAKLSAAARLGAPAGPGHGRHPHQQRPRPSSGSSATPPTAPWQESAAPTTALIGHKGVGLGAAFRSFARKGEPVKVEGDKRAPAGFYKIGRSFGFAVSDRPGYMRVSDGMTCVDDLSSPAYNTITTRERDRREGAWREHVARAGISPRPVGRLSEQPQGAGRLLHFHPPATARKNRHQRLRRAAGAAARSRAGFTCKRRVLAILPRQALDRFKGCLPAPGNR